MADMHARPKPLTC